MGELLNQVRLAGKIAGELSCEHSMLLVTKKVLPCPSASPYLHQDGTAWLIYSKLS